MNIISRKKAIEQKLRYYFTGKTCPQGHVSKRPVYSGSCYMCMCEASEKADAKNPSARRARMQRYLLRLKNKSLGIIEDLEIKETYEDRLKRRRAKGTATEARRYAKKLNATPHWSETEEINEFYENCPPEMEVDHIVPLKGRRVSGLHVLANLQYLSKSDNISKGNRFEPMFSSTP